MIVSLSEYMLDTWDVSPTQLVNNLVRRLNDLYLVKQSFNASWSVEFFFFLSRHTNHTQLPFFISIADQTHSGSDSCHCWSRSPPCCQCHMPRARSPSFVSFPGKFPSCLNLSRVVNSSIPAWGSTARHFTFSENIYSLDSGFVHLLEWIEWMPGVRRSEIKLIN